MNNHLSYYGLVDARINASEKDLPVIWSWIPLGYSGTFFVDCYGIQQISWGSSNRLEQVSSFPFMFHNDDFINFSLVNQAINNIDILYFK